MASKKKATGGTTALTKWDAKLAEMAAQAATVEQNVGGGNMIGLQGGRLQYKGAEIPENKMEVVILDHILHNAFYEDNFDPNNPSSPVCFAFGISESEMAPHEDSSAPQHETCAGCPQNEWGSADTGRGKACGNKRRLGLISKGDLEDDIMAAEVAFMHLPVTSIKGWAGYVRQIADIIHRPPLGVITEITVVPDAASQFKVMFKMVETIDDGEIMGALIQKSELVHKEIDFPYVQIEGAATSKKSKPRGRANVVAPPARRVVKPRTQQQAVVRPPATAGRGAAQPAKRSKF